MTADCTRNMLETYDGEEIQDVTIELKVNGKKQQGGLLVADNTPLLSSTNVKRVPIELPDNGLSISDKMAELLDVEAGDIITWHMYGDAKWISSKIDAVYRSPFMQGITMSRKTYENLGFTMPGIPLGHLLMNTVLNTMPENFDMMPSVSFGSYLLSVSGTVIISIFVCQLFSKRVKSLDMVSSLKGVE